MVRLALIDVLVCETIRFVVGLMRWRSLWPTWTVPMRWISFCLFTYCIQNNSKGCFVIVIVYNKIRVTLS